VIYHMQLSLIEMGPTFLPRLALNSNPSDLCLHG
jgi:hypothetical protein